MIKDKNMTTGSEWKEILLFSLPLMLGQILQQFYNTVDGIVVGNFATNSQEANEIALAAVGGGFPLIMLYLSICIGLVNGGSVQISQLYGARQLEKLRRAASTQIITLGILGLTLSVVGYVSARPMITSFLRYTHPVMIEQGVDYYSIYAIGLVFVYVYNCIAGTLRAIGDSKASMYLLIFSTILNTVLDLVFVISFGWGVAGVAIATVISQAACCIFMFLYMYLKYPILRLTKSNFVFDKELFKVSLRLGIPSMIQQTVISFGGSMMQRLINGFESPALMSAFTVGNRMENYALVPIFCLGTGLSTFTGQNVGAGKFERVKKGWLATIIMSVLISSTLSFIIYFIAPEFSQLFGLSDEARAMAIEFQRFMSFAIILFALYMPTGSALQGAGDAIWATAASFTTLTVRVVAAYLLVYNFSFGYQAAWVTMPLGWAFAIIITYSRFFSGKWKLKRVVHELPPDVPEEGLYSE